MQKKYLVKKSPIHGNGVFAAVPIKKGEFIAEYLGEKIDKAESNRRGLAYEEAAKKRAKAASISSSSTTNTTSTGTSNTTTQNT